MTLSWKFATAADALPVPPAMAASPVAGRGNGVEVVVARLTPALVAVPTLSAPERQRVRRFAHAGAGRRFALGRTCLRQLIGARLGVAPAAIELACNAYGKPVLAGRFAAAPLRFNVAYAGDMAVYAFAVGREVGVDVEAVRAFDAAAAVVRGFFAPGEQASFGALAMHDRLLGFFSGWTRKEAFIKALGTGIYRALDSFEVSLAPHEAARIIRVGKTAGEDCGWTLQSFTPAPGFVAAVVVQRFPGEAYPLPARKAVRP